MSFVQQHQATFGVEPVLAVLGEPVSTFYDWAGRKPSAQALSDAALLERIEAVWEASRRTYGSPGCTRCCCVRDMPSLRTGSPG